MIHKTALDARLYDSPMRADVRAAILTMPDGELAQLLAERSRLESRTAVGLHACPGCGDDTARPGMCPACEEYERAEQRTHDRQWLTPRAHALATQRDTIDGEEIPF